MDSRNFLKACYCKDLYKLLFFDMFKGGWAEMRIYLKYLRKAAMNTIEILVLLFGALLSVVALILGYMEDKQKARKLLAIGIVLIITILGHDKLIS